jgi:hypothetical protein
MAGADEKVVEWLDRLGFDSRTQGPQESKTDEKKLKITVGGTELTATIQDNSSAKALVELLADGPLTITMNDYGGMEKVGDLGASLPRNDKKITTAPGDLVLYQGNAFVIYYAPNTWSLTRLGTIDGITKDELLSILGSGNTTVTLSVSLCPSTKPPEATAP